MKGAKKMRKSSMVITVLLVLSMFSFVSTTKAWEPIIVSGFADPRNRAPLHDFAGNAPGGIHGSSTLETALLDPANFGPGGVVDCSIQFLPFVQIIATNSLVDAAGIRLVDVFFAGLTAVTLIPAEVNELIAFLRAGGVLYISGNTMTNEGPSYNPLLAVIGPASYLVLTSGSNYVQSSNPAPTPVTTGPFGVVGPLMHTPYRHISPGGSIGGVANGGGTVPNTVILAEGAIGSGYISLTGDPLYFNFFLPGGTNPDPDNLNYFLNLFALACKPPPVGAPLFSDILTMLPLGIVVGALVIRRRRKANN